MSHHLHNYHPAMRNYTCSKITKRLLRCVLRVEARTFDMFRGLTGLIWIGYLKEQKLDPGVNFKYVGTREQLADLLTKASFTIAKWNVLLKLHQIGLFGGKQKRTHNTTVQNNKTAKTNKRRHKLVRSALSAHLRQFSLLQVALQNFLSGLYVSACRRRKVRRVLKG